MRLRRARDLTLILGPCGAGKTAYARRRYPECVQPDYEALIRALTPDGLLHYDPSLRALATRWQRQMALDALARGLAVCVTIGGATRQERAQWVALAQQQGALVAGVRLVVSEATCLARCVADPTRPATSKSKWAKITRKWFARYEAIDAAAEGFASYEEVMWE